MPWLGLQLSGVSLALVACTGPSVGSHHLGTSETLASTADTRLVYNRSAGQWNEGNVTPNQIKNGALTRNSYTHLLSRFGDVMVTMLAIELVASDAPGPLMVSAPPAKADVTTDKGEAHAQPSGTQAGSTGKTPNSSTTLEVVAQQGGLSDDRSPRRIVGQPGRGDRGNAGAIPRRQRCGTDGDDLLRCVGKWKELTQPAGHLREVPSGIWASQNRSVECSHGACCPNNANGAADQRYRSSTQHAARRPDDSVVEFGRVDRGSRIRCYANIDAGVAQACPRSNHHE
ncbi:hypothetical protein LMG32289_02625 [Cupriavidus pampae]|uniref:Uncharacterized protein n=1 Tax=Cupriavidus pampae TaxID=659251 RepID=A0ABM8WYB9_9BURK|nr:hypothetical protein LMG32289_02625 [Cupriavidus pampae]